MPDSEPHFSVLASEGEEAVLGKHIGFALRFVKKHMAIPE